jgi:hypothetical protein
MADGTGVKYTLDANELDSLSQRLLSEQPPKTDERFICYMLPGASELANLARHVEREVFEESFGIDDANMRRMYAPFEPHSMFFLVMDQEGVKPAGVSRYGKNLPAGSLTLCDAEKLLNISTKRFQEFHEVESMDNVWDLGTTVVPKAYRHIDNHLVGNILYRSLHSRAMHEGVKHYVTILDADVRRQHYFFGFPWVPLVGTGIVSHEGSVDSMFLYAKAQDLPPCSARALAKADKKLKPIIAQFIKRVFCGQGIDHRLMFEISNCWLSPEDDVKEWIEAA